MVNRKTILFAIFLRSTESRTWLLHTFHEGLALPPRSIRILALHLMQFFQKNLRDGFERLKIKIKTNPAHVLTVIYTHGTTSKTNAAPDGI